MPRAELKAHLFRGVEPRPVGGGAAQAFYHWILTDVIGFEFKLRVVADAVIEVAILPGDFVVGSVVVFPFTDDARHGRRRRK